MQPKIKLGGFVLDVVKKDIQNIHLSVYPPNGKVRISAPMRMKLDTLRVFAISKLSWIKRQQKKLREQERETPREYLDRESHHVWGKRYLLKVVEKSGTSALELKHSILILRIRPGTNRAQKQIIIDKWYREQTKIAVPALIAQWETILNVKVNRFFVQRMKTKWGSCNPRSGSIRFNSELAKKTRECLAYIVVHEMIHLLEPTHNHRFHALMNHYLPQWKHDRDDLNRAPLAHEQWGY